MAEDYVRLPSDTSNTGKKVRTNLRTVGANDVEEHFMILQDYTNNYQTQVDSTGHLFVGGSISSIPLIGSESYIKAGSVEVYNRIAGSIVDMPSLVGSFGVTALPGILGSVYVLSNVVGVSGTYFQDMLGSVQVNTGSVRAQVVQITSPWVTSGTSTIEGSVYVTGSVYIANQYLGSETWIKAGSIQTYTPLGSTFVTGSIYTTGSIRAINLYEGSESYIKAGSIQTYTPLGSTFIMGSVYAVGSIWFGGVGSVVISNMPAIGSWTGYVGSIWSMPSISTGSESWIKGGSIQTYSPLGSTFILGSVYSTGSFSWAPGVGSVVVSGLVSLSGVWTGVGSIVISGTSIPPWRGTGSITFADGTVGSIVISGTSIPPMRGIGSIWFGGGIGSVIISGTSIPVWQNTGSVVISGTSIPPFRGVGSVHIGTGIGSVYVVDSNTDNLVNRNVGSPCFKTSYLIASGAWSQTWSIGGAGSRLEIHGWHISTNLPGWVRILVSGTANNAYDSGLIANYFLNFASGGVVEKTFVSPIIPAGAGSAIGFGTTSAGSTNVTIFGREVK